MSPLYVRESTGTIVQQQHGVIISMPLVVRSYRQPNIYVKMMGLILNLLPSKGGLSHPLLGTRHDERTDIVPSGLVVVHVLAVTQGERPGLPAPVVAARKQQIGGSEKTQRV